MYYLMIYLWVYRDVKLEKRKIISSCFPQKCALTASTGGGTCIFIHSRSARLIYFKIIFIYRVHESQSFLGGGGRGNVSVINLPLEINMLQILQIHLIARLLVTMFCSF